MPRTKKTPSPEMTIEEKLASRQKDKETILAEQIAIEANIEEQKKLLKAKKKEARATDRDIAALQAKKEKEDAARAAKEQKAALEKVVEGLLQKGKTADDILAAFPE